MDRSKVLSAIRTIKDSLANALADCSMLNMAGGSHLENRERITPYWDKLCAKHRQWDAEYRQALDDLRKEKYPIPERWNEIDLSEPQLCFSEVPIEKYSNGKPTGKIWVIGCGDNPEERRIPDYVRQYAGDFLEGGGLDCDVLAGVMFDGIYREWQEVYREVETAEQSLTIVSLLRTPEVKLDNDDRDAWLYDQFTRMERGQYVTHDTIVKRLERECTKHDWQFSDNIKTLKDAANRWAERKDKAPIPVRKHGRPAAR